MRLGILLFTPILLLAGVTLHAQEAVNAPEPVAAGSSAANAELKAQLKARLLCGDPGRALFRSEDRRQQRGRQTLTADRRRVRRGRHDAQFLQRQLPALYQP